MKNKLLFAILAIVLIIMTVGCSKEMVEESTSSADEYESSIAEVENIDNEIVDSSLEESMDDINLDDW